MDGTEESVPIRARATINLPGLPVGYSTLVDPTTPYVADCIEAGFLVPVEDDKLTE